MWLSLLLPLLLHSLTVSSLNPPSVASLQQNSGLSLVNVTTAPNATTIAPAANIDLEATIEEGLQKIYSDDQFRGAYLVLVWLVHRGRGREPWPTSLLDFQGFNLLFLLDGRHLMLNYDDWGGGNYWDGPRLGGRTLGDHQEMQWNEVQDLVSLDEADQLMTSAGYGGRDIRDVSIEDKRDEGLGYWFLYQNPVEEVFLNARTREITVEHPENVGSLSEE